VKYVTCYGLNDWHLISGRVTDFLFATTSRPALEPTAFYLVSSGTHFLGIEQLNHEAYYSPTAIAS
jgi:hypothetical protein